MTKPKIHYCDTNFILRYLLQDEPLLYEQADAFFDKVKDGLLEVCILEAVIVECVYVMSKYYKISRDEIAEILMKFISYKGIRIDSMQDVQGALQRFASSTQLDIVDCLLAEKSSASKTVLKTFLSRLKSVST